MTSLPSTENVRDSVYAIELLNKVEIGGGNVLQNRAYRAHTLQAYISECGFSYMIPPQSNISKPCAVGWSLYNERHLIKCLFLAF